MLVITIASALMACETGPPLPSDPLQGTGARYFESPQKAVPRIAAMLRQSQWPQLASYYDLSESPVTRDELTSGRYFLSAATETPPLPPPDNELARYRHPFHPSYRFHRVRRTDDSKVVVVELMLEVDQGEGAPPRRSIDEFRMIRHPRGWQILPAFEG
jgi:hypothetical protein